MASRRMRPNPTSTDTTAAQRCAVDYILYSTQNGYILGRGVNKYKRMWEAVTAGISYLRHKLPATP